MADTNQVFQGSGYRLRALLRSMALSEGFYAVAPAAGKEVAQK
jgi:hypothetical protein